MVIENYIKSGYMKRFKFDVDKSQSALLFILQSLGGRSGMLKPFKILYFADRDHLAVYGRPITGDVYAAMPNGPVPSTIRDGITDKRYEYNSSNKMIKVISDSIDFVQPHFIQANLEPDLSVLSESDIEFLTKSIKENKDLTFGQLSEKSHDFAWNASFKENRNIIPVLSIAEAGGANEAMLDYIREKIQNQSFLDSLKIA